MFFEPTVIHLDRSARDAQAVFLSAAFCDRDVSYRRLIHGIDDFASLRRRARFCNGLLPLEGTMFEAEVGGDAAANEGEAEHHHIQGHATLRPFLDPGVPPYNGFLLGQSCEELERVAALVLEEAKRDEVSIGHGSVQTQQLLALLKAELRRLEREPLDGAIFDLPAVG